MLCFLCCRDGAALGGGIFALFHFACPGYRCELRYISFFRSSNSYLVHPPDPARCNTARFCAFCLCLGWVAAPPCCLGAPPMRRRRSVRVASLCSICGSRALHRRCHSVSKVYRYRQRCKATDYCPTKRERPALKAQGVRQRGSVPSPSSRLYSPPSRSSCRQREYPLAGDLAG